MRKQIVLSTAAIALILGGCANMSDTQKGAAIGAGVGATVGAVAGKGKGAVIGAVVGAGAGAVAGNVWSKRQEEQKREMEEATAGTGVVVSQTEDNQLKLDIPSDISFAVGRADIQSNFRGVLDAFATSLVKNPSSQVTIVGHTDSTGSDAVNNPLSLNRAASVRDYLSTRDVAINRIAIDGRGSREPMTANDTPENRTKNRRVEIFVAEPAPAPTQH